MKINELTQGMAEKLVDCLPDGPTSQVKYESAFLRACAESGWVEGLEDISAMPRKAAKAAYVQLSKLWLEANELPNG